MAQQPINPPTANQQSSENKVDEPPAAKDTANESSTAKGKDEEIEYPPIRTFKKKDDLEKYLKESKKRTCQLMVLIFTTTWCKPCITADEYMREIAYQFGDVNFANVDVDYFQDLAKDLKVTMMPTVLLMKRCQCSSNKRDKNEEKGNNADSNKGKVSATTGSMDKEDKDGNKGKKDQNVKGEEEKKTKEKKETKSELVTNFNEVYKVVGINKNPTSFKENLSAKIGDHRYRIDLYTP